MSIAEALKPPPTPTRMLDAVPPDTRVVFHDVTWDAYESLVDALGERANCRVAFDGKDIEMMTLGPSHERQRSRVDWFIMIVAEELRIRNEPMGSTTWKRKGLERASESDLCYYFDLAKLTAVAAAADSDDVDDFPNPDLAIEVDVSPPKIDRSGIYVALEVPEFWRRVRCRCRSSSSALAETTFQSSGVASCLWGPRTSRGGSLSRTRPIG